MTPEVREAYEHARQLKKQEKFQEALDFLEENLLETERDSSVLHYLEGECFQGLGDIETACEAFKNAYLSTPVKGY